PVCFSGSGGAAGLPSFPTRRSSDLVRRARARPEGSGRHWHIDGEADVFDVKADAMAVLVAAGAPPQALQVVPGGPSWLHPGRSRSEEHTSELQSLRHLVCRLLLEKK